MTHTATSASERYEKARAILARYDAIDSDDDPGYHDRVDAAIDGLGALRAFIEPAATDESVNEIADRLSGTVGYHDGQVMFGNVDVRNLLTRAVLAGIQAAWNSWEPDDYAPTVCEKCGGDV